MALERKDVNEESAHEQSTLAPKSDQSPKTHEATFLFIYLWINGGNGHEGQQ